jgi:hypothetical protein
MSIGNPVDSGGLNAKIGDAAVSIRQASDLMKEIASYILKIGQSALQQPPFSYSAADATALVTKAGQYNNLSGVYFGTATQAATFNYDDAFTIDRGINP